MIQSRATINIQRDYTLGKRHYIIAWVFVFISITRQEVELSCAVIQSRAMINKQIFIHWRPPNKWKFIMKFGTFRSIRSVGNMLSASICIRNIHLANAIGYVLSSILRSGLQFIAEDAFEYNRNLKIVWVSLVIAISHYEMLLRMMMLLLTAEMNCTISIVFPLWPNFNQFLRWSVTSRSCFKVLPVLSLYSFLQVFPSAQNKSVYLQQGFISHLPKCAVTATSIIISSVTQSPI